jgi:class 3 adenylate cyclase/GAF domain-containing protein
LATDIGNGYWQRIKVLNSYFWETVLFLQGNFDANSKKIFSQENIKENNLLNSLINSKDLRGIFYFYSHRAILHFFWGEIAEANEDVVRARPYLVGGAGSTCEAGLYFYDSLIALASIPNSSAELETQQQRVQENQTKLQHWAEHCHENYLHKWQLVEAEKYRVLGKKAEAIELYDLAIAGAKANDYIQEEALANELAAKFYLKWKKEKIAQFYMKSAYYCYQLWGATAKIKYLEQQYPKLLATTATKIQDTKLTTLVTTSNSSSYLDIATLIKSTNTIYGEIVLDKLLSILMKILLENAGAETGYLLLNNHGKLLIEAAGDIQTEKTTVLQSISLEVCQTICQSIVNYVARTQESVVLNNATKEGKFTNDIYIKANQPKSILCVPLINQGQLVSIVYLENNLTTGAFTPERVQVLQLLSGQAAISIQNAKLYPEVRANEQRLVELNQAYQRFVPGQFLQFLNKSSIVDVQLGDQVQLKMSVLFSDIRDFTSISEKMSPEENFKFINSYLSRMEPAIAENSGFIDKYIGDAIMALFSGAADNAVKAGIAMLYRLGEYNQHRRNSGYPPIKIGIGINTGSLMLGTFGGQNRMNGTVISDAVNLASRIEGLTKTYGCSLLISEHTFSRLQKPQNYAIRMIAQVQVKGKSQQVTVYEVFEADSPEIKAGKLATQEPFSAGCFLYNIGRFEVAAEQFEFCLKHNPGDRVAQIYLQQCRKK